MAYFEDLTSYTYRPGEEHIVNVGWLAAAQPFCLGAVSEKFAIRLQKLCNTPCNLMRGHHYCDVCTPPQDILGIDPSYLHVWAMNRCGSGEIRVRDKLGVIYSAPSLIWHYVMEHQYQPPQEFVDAVIYAADDPSTQPKCP
jgi:hypothetical protein